MPIFEYEGKKYNVRDEHMDQFINEFPDATSVMERDGKKYRVKSSDYKTFLSEKPQESVKSDVDASAPQQKKRPSLPSRQRRCWRAARNRRGKWHETAIGISEIRRELHSRKRRRCGAPRCNRRRMQPKSCAFRMHPTLFRRMILNHQASRRIERR